jgi:SSS family solute:Na+ symporter
MSIIDWIVLILFFLALAGIAMWVLKNRKDDTSDYFLSGRRETWLAVGAAIFAVNIGSEHLVCLSMAHYKMQGWIRFCTFLCS